MRHYNSGFSRMYARGCARMRTHAHMHELTIPKKYVVSKNQASAPLAPLSSQPAAPAPAADGRRIQTRRSGVHGKGVFAVEDLAEGETLSASDADRVYSQVLGKTSDAGVWIPLFHDPLFLAMGSKIKPVKAHGVEGTALYKGLDLQMR